MKFLIPLVALGALFFAASPANAAPAIPPTEECLALTQTMMDNYPDGVVSDDQERAILQSLVDAGCLERNPVSSDIPVMPKGECQALASEVSSYLVPANAAARPISKRIEAISRNINKKGTKLYKRLAKAQKRGDNKAAKKIRREIKKTWKSLDRSWANLARKNQSVLDEYLAPIILVTLDMETRGCDPGKKWDNKNPAPGTIIFLWAMSKI